MSSIKYFLPQTSWVIYALHDALTHNFASHAKLRHFQSNPQQIAKTCGLTFLHILQNHKKNGWVLTSSLLTSKMASEAAIHLGLLILLKAVQGFVIAPPWANPVINPCSEKSWQLIYWPQDGACYQIFEQGPCPDTQELAFHPTNKRVSFNTVQSSIFCPKNLFFF